MSPFSKSPILLLPLQQMPREHIHHLYAAEFLKVFLPRLTAVCWRPRFPTFAARTLQLLQHALQKGTAITRAIGSVAAVAVACGARALRRHGHLDLHPRNEFQYPCDSSLHLVHRRSLRVHIPWPTGFPRLAAAAAATTTTAVHVWPIAAYPWGIRSGIM